ncbi:MAG: CDP-diacylglycerol--serine O-phosphatidyltransferase [Chloroflexota bacterium]
MKLTITRSIVPNMLTLGNLFCGFSALVFASDGDFMRASLFVLFAAVFDMLDGVIARLLRSTSEIGAELDSLCDAVSFGVAPSFILYKIFFFTWGDTGLLLASMPALAGVARLARFNVQLTSFEDKLYFKGMPIPSGALTILSYVVFFHTNPSIDPNLKSVLIVAVTVVTSLAMVSTIKFDNLPRPSKRSIKQRPYAFAVAVVGLILSVVTLGKAIFPFMLFYIIVSVIRYIYVKFAELRKSNLEIEDLDDLDEDSDTHTYEP